ncbi:MAG TPA: amino acid permease [Nitrososphaerales archaeon]|nr:amino acid permease [Nitrososphaerales archaeon]
MTASTQGLRKAITLRYAVALYVSSVLGSGVLVLPGLAAQLAGPGSLLAWVLLSLVSYPFAYTFASLSARKPEAGGIYSFAKESFGLRIATVTGWLFALWFITGGPAVMLIAASYVAYAFPMSRAETFVIAGAIIFSVFVVNYRGIVVSNKVQLAVVVSIVALLLATVISSSSLVRLENLEPFLPNGLLPIGVSAALIFWSFLGYENVSNVAEEFRDPKKDFHRSILLSVALVSGLYIAVAFVTVGTLAYKSGGSVAPFAAILSNVLGVYGAIGTAILAVFIIFGTANAYMTGMSRVIYAVARDGGLPRVLNHLSKETSAPDRSILALVGLSFSVLLVFYVFGVDLETALLIPSGAAILTYVIGAAAGVRLLKQRVFPYVTLAISLAILPFLGALLLFSLATMAAAALYSRFFQGRGDARV